MNDLTKKVLMLISEWKKNRENLIKKLKSNIIKLNEVQKNVDISKLVGNSTAIIGTTMAIIGAILTPFTFGASLGLTISGGSLSAAGSLTSAGSHLANFCISKSELKIAQDMLNEDKRLLLEIQDILRDANFKGELISFLSQTGSSLSTIFGVIHLTSAVDDVAKLSTYFVTKVVSNLPLVLTHITIALNLFGALCNIIDIFHTSKSVINSNLSLD
jgi:hypothetical protein